MEKILLLFFKSYKALCSLIFSCLTMVSCDLFLVSSVISVKRLRLSYESHVSVAEDIYFCCTECSHSSDLHMTV